MTWMASVPSNMIGAAATLHVDGRTIERNEPFFYEGRLALSRGWTRSSAEPVPASLGE